jgi:hypothetical protein
MQWATQLSWRGAHPRPPGQNRGTGAVLGTRVAAGVRAHAVRPARMSHRGACAARVRSNPDGERRKVSREDDQRARLAIERDDGRASWAGRWAAREVEQAGGPKVRWVSR